MDWRRKKIGRVGVPKVRSLQERWTLPVRWALPSADSRRTFLPQSLLTSLLLHALGIFALFTITFPQIISVFPENQHVTLVTPALSQSAPERRHIDAPAVSNTPRDLRRFQPATPPKPVTPRIVVEPPEVSLLVPPPNPTPLLQQIPSVKPPLRTDSFPDVRPSASSASPKTTIRTNNLTDAQLTDAADRRATAIKTDNFSDPRVAMDSRPARSAVQAAGFAGPESTTPNVKRGSISSGAFGSANLARVEPATRGPVAADGAGFGGPALTTAVSTTANAQRGTVTSAGFGSANTTAAPASRGTGESHGAGFGGVAVASARSARGGVIAKSEFGDIAISTAPRAAKDNRASDGTKPVEILSKPSPAYTDEARKLKVEGEVVVEILFPAAGPARVLRIVRGLGHGLDESAIAAVQDIRFHPAQQGGVAVDSTVVVHVLFQLAL